jgi:hypothetical protein
MRIWEWLEDRPPARVAFVSLIAGVALLAGSFAVGVDSTQVAGKHVGFKSAPNWGLSFAILVPLAIYFFLQAIHDGRIALRQLGVHRMLVDAKGDVFPDAAAWVDAKWTAELRSYAAWAFVLASAAFLESWGEWYFSAGRYLLAATPAKPPEVDWSVAAALHVAGTNAVANALFGFVAFTFQGCFVAALLIFVVFAFAYCDFVGGLADADTEPLLIVDTSSHDPRRGFETFEKLAEDFLLGCSFAFTVFYLSSIWNIYLRNPALTLNEFVIGDIAAGYSKGMGAATSSFFEAGEFDFSRTMVSIAACVLFPVVLLFLIIILRRAALQARATTERLQPANAAGLDLTKLVVWPMSYPPLNMLLLLVLFAIVCLVCFRFGLIYLGAFILMVVTRVFRMLKP